MDQNMAEDMDLEVDRICQNCGSFFQDHEDLLARECPGLGVCLNDEEFEPFIEEILENGDFSCCHELYLQKRYDGGREACEQFEVPEMIELPEGMSLDEYLQFEALKYQNVDELIQSLYSSDMVIVRKGLATISMYFYNGNEGALEGLLNYYISLGPAESLEEVHLRIEIVEMLSRYEPDRRIIEAYVKELERTQSNNTTRKLYTLILRRLEWCPHEIVDDLLIELLNRKQYSFKMKKRLMEIAGL